MDQKIDMTPTERMYVEVASLIDWYCATYDTKPYMLGKIALGDPNFPKLVLRIARGEQPADEPPKFTDYFTRVNAEKTQTVHKLAKLEHFILHSPVSPAEFAARQVA